MRCTPIYEMHGYAYMWDCLRCTPIYKITLDVRVCEGCTPMCEGCTPMCEVHAYVRCTPMCEVHAYVRCTPM